MTDTIIVARPHRDPGNLTLSIGGVDYTGWEEIAVTLRAEGFPPSFETTTSIGAGGVLPASAGDECDVWLGDDHVISGYVDRVIDSGDAMTHRISIIGRGRTCDLVDCGAEWPSHQMIGGNAETIARNLAKPYGITVRMGPGASPGPDVSKWPLNYGETAADIIQRVARNAGLLAFEDVDGALVLANVGATRAASGAVWGRNVEEWSVQQAMDQRFSEYVCCSESMDAMMELPGSDFYDVETDPNVPRHRRMYLVVEQVASDPQAFTVRRAKWEAARRAGRAFVCQATIDSWRDDGGALWMPNTLVPFSLPAAIDPGDLVISEVTFRRDNTRGTTAQIVAMPRAAFTPEPISLVPVNTADLVPATGGRQ